MRHWKKWAALVAGLGSMIGSPAMARTEGHFYDLVATLDDGAVFINTSDITRSGNIVHAWMAIFTPYPKPGSMSVEKSLDQINCVEKTYKTVTSWWTYPDGKVRTYTNPSPTTHYAVPGTVAYKFYESACGLKPPSAQWFLEDGAKLIAKTSVDNKRAKK